MVDKWITQLEPYFTKKAPVQIPVKAREWIVNYSWIISLVLAVILVPAMLSLLTIYGWAGAVAGALGVVVSPLYWLAGLALVVQFVFLVVSIPGLKKKSYAKGWKIVLYGEIFGFAYSMLYFTMGNLISGVLSLIIGVYVLFQIKSYYN
jgi:hypothetical protein